MAKRARPRLARPSRASPTRVAVAPSSAPPEDVQNAPLDVDTLPIQSLSLCDAAPAEPAPSGQALVAGQAVTAATAAIAVETQTTTTTTTPARPFRFLDLPSELRVKIYGYHFAGTDPVADLTPDNAKTVRTRLVLLRTCRTIYAEASHVYYSTRTFRLFPTYPGRFFKTRRPLLARLSPRQRAAMTSLELRLGPGFNKPPRGWVVNEALGLADCVHVRKLCVFVQLDPSLSFLDGFRKPGFYEAFSRALLDDVLAATPSVQVVEFDAYESVRMHCPIMDALLHTARAHGKLIAWGKQNSWAREGEGDGDGPDNGEGAGGGPADAAHRAAAPTVPYDRTIVAAA